MVEISEKQYKEYLELKRQDKRRRTFNSGICPDCGERLFGKHTMGEGWKYSSCNNPDCIVNQSVLDEKTLKMIKKALELNYNNK